MKYKRYFSKCSGSNFNLQKLSFFGVATSSHVSAVYFWKITLRFILMDFGAIECLHIRTLKQVKVQTEDIETENKRTELQTYQDYCRSF